MRELTLLGLIIGVALIVSAVISSATQVYFSPYQSCVRAYSGAFAASGAAAKMDHADLTAISTCLNMMGGKNSN